MTIPGAADLRGEPVRRRWTDDLGGDDGDLSLKRAERGTASTRFRRRG